MIYILHHVRPTSPLSSPQGQWSYPSYALSKAKADLADFGQMLSMVPWNFVDEQFGLFFNQRIFLTKAYLVSCLPFHVY